MSGECPALGFIEEQQTEALQPFACRDWKRSKGKCAYGIKCKFLHPKIDLSLDLSVARKDRTKTESGKPKRVKRNNKHRNKIFCEWLIRTIGHDRMQSGSGVLDIAGGQGEISFILLNVYDIESTIIDPRDKINYSKFITKQTAGNYKTKKEIASTEIHKLERDIRLPTHVKLFFTPMLWECAWNQAEMSCKRENYAKDYFLFQQRKDEASFLNIYQSLVEESKNCWNPLTLLTGSSNEEKIEIDDGDEAPTLEQVASLCNEYSCIIGMHPDQATEAIVDFALLTQKPFAILPCCVCSKQFPNRIHNDQLVKSFDSLVDHIKSKNENIKEEILPFGGKNKVLYFLPPLDQ